MGMKFWVQGGFNFGLLVGAGQMIRLDFFSDWGGVFFMNLGKLNIRINKSADICVYMFFKKNCQMAKNNVFTKRS